LFSALFGDASIWERLETRDSLIERRYEIKSKERNPINISTSKSRLRPAMMDIINYLLLSFSANVDGERKGKKMTNHLALQGELSLSACPPALHTRQLQNTPLTSSTLATKEK
jgi:hypothetical protein